ncbi:hypothetical protein KEM48_009840 [Puccinia striiformis f. sp. tritici PST-130]|nr:hypothetical protein KEM48_009840 [Puccinia striiformis f. sp. tritici PST-130]
MGSYESAAEGGWGPRIPALSRAPRTSFQLLVHSQLTHRNIRSTSVKSLELKATEKSCKHSATKCEAPPNKPATNGERERHSTISNTTSNQPHLPSPNHRSNKVNSIRKTRVTRAAAKAPNPSQEVDPATKGTDEIGSTPVQEPSVLESSGEMATTLGEHTECISQAQREGTQSSVVQRTKAKESTMDTLVAKLIQAQEDGQDEAANRYFKLIEMLTTKHQPDPQQQVVAQQQTLAVVPTKRKSTHDETTEVRGLKSNHPTQPYQQGQENPDREEDTEASITTRTTTGTGTAATTGTTIKEREAANQGQAAETKGMGIDPETGRF